jgi:solute carrier family 1 (high affinity glutamate transporter) protein 2
VYILKVNYHIRTNFLLFLTICAIFAGVALGFLGRLYKPNDTALLLISFPGEMLLRVLKMLILPLIISSLITGLAQLDPKSSGKMGSRALFFYVFTTFVATLTG